VEASVADQSATLLALASELAQAARTLTGDEEANFWATAPSLPSPTGEDRGVSIRGEGRAVVVTAGDGDAARGASLLLKVSLLPAEVAGWLATLGEVARASGLATQWRAHLGHGIVYAQVSGAGEALPAAVDALRQRASARRGSLVVQGAPPAMARQIDVWGPTTALGMMRRLKERFDSHATLNPGRFVGGI
jgi:hypothetical protein